MKGAAGENDPDAKTRQRSKLVKPCAPASTQGGFAKRSRPSASPAIAPVGVSDRHYDIGNGTYMTFGGTVSEARRRRNLNQRQLAARVIKEDGRPISPQYLNDFEHERRTLSSGHLIEQVAEALGISEYVLASVELYDGISPRALAR